MTRLTFFTIVALMGADRLIAQDTTRVDEGVRVGVDYRPGVRPGLVVLPGPGLDSVRAIVRRDLDYTDRFEMVTVAEVSSASPPGRGAADEGGGVNYGLYKALGAEFAVELADAGGRVTVRLHDLNAGRIRNQQTVTLSPSTTSEFRMDVHRLSDEIARWASGVAGAAASRLGPASNWAWHHRAYPRCRPIT